MTTKLYIQDRFITTIDELRLLVEETGDNPSTIIAKQLIAAACDGVLESWLKDALDDNEHQKSLPQERFVSLKDIERWKYIKKVITGNDICSGWDWIDKIELTPPNDDFLDSLEKGEITDLTFCFRCKELMDESIDLWLRVDGYAISGGNFVLLDQTKEQKHTLDLNKTTQEITFVVDGGKFKGKVLELFVHDNPKPIWRKELEYGIYQVKGVKFKMVRVVGGIFNMGENGERHEVELDSYSIGETVVTQKLWNAVMGKAPSSPTNGSFPVNYVSWDDCQNFIKELNKETGKKFRLPTEAEWEFAARGGNKEKDKNYLYSGSNKIDDVAWFKNNGNWVIHPARSKKPNKLGIFDLSGNVREWCQDYYKTYDLNARINPRGPSSGYYHILRGGSFCDREWECNVSYRFYDKSYSRQQYYGFRLAI